MHKTKIFNKLKFLFLFSFLSLSPISLVNAKSNIDVDKSKSIEGLLSKHWEINIEGSVNIFEAILKTFSADLGLIVGYKFWRPKHTQNAYMYNSSEYKPVTVSGGYGALSVNIGIKYFAYNTYITENNGKIKENFLKIPIFLKYTFPDFFNILWDTSISFGFNIKYLVKSRYIAGEKESDKNIINESFKKDINNLKAKFKNIKKIFGDFIFGIGLKTPLGPYLNISYEFPINSLFKPTFKLVDTKLDKKYINEVKDYYGALTFDIGLDILLMMDFINSLKKKSD